MKKMIAAVAAAVALSGLASGCATDLGKFNIPPILTNAPPAPPPGP